MIYSNKEIIEQIKEDRLREAAEFLDSRGVILLQYQNAMFDTTLSILTTKKDILKIIYNHNSNFVKVELNDNIYIGDVYLDETNLLLFIESKYDGIAIGKYCFSIPFNSYEDYCKLDDYLSSDRFSKYNIQDITYMTYTDDDDKIIVKLKEFKNEMHKYDKDKFLYVVFDFNNIDHYKVFEHLPPNYNGIAHSIIATPININDMNWEV